MSSNSDDIQAAGSDTRPPMLDRTDYESWSQRIRLYCRGKENGLQILQSIDQGPFKLGTTRDALGTTPEGGVLLGPERPRTYEDLSDTEKKRYDADVRATNIVLQGLPKDIYKLINHNIEAKASWDNVKMLLAGSELTKEDRESQLYDEFERFKMLSGENINEYYVRFHKLVNNMRNIRMTMPNIQLNSKFLYAYLKQHEKHAAQDRLIIKRITPATNDQLAFVSTVQPHAQSSHVQSHQYPSSSTNLQSPHYPQFPETSQIDSGYTQTDEILDNLTKHIGTPCPILLEQRFLRPTINFEPHPTPEIKQLFKMVGLSFRMFKGDRIRIRGILLWEMVQQEMGVHIIELGMPMQADECDAFDSNVDDEPTAQSIFMANLSSVGSANPQAGPSNASILSEVHILENAIDHSVSNQDEYEIHNKVQPSNVIDSTSVHMGNSNVIPYEQYLSVNDISVVPSCASSALNSVCVSPVNDAIVPHDPIAIELKIYKEQVAIYEQRAKFELTEREQRMDDQMRMLIQNRNKTEENLKKELHSFKLQLKSTMENNKIIEETVTTLKQEFKQKESKFLTDFSNLKHLNDKLENKLHSQDQSIQTVHMMLNPTQVYDQKTKTALGAQNPFYLRQAKKAQPALYDGDELLKPHHVPVMVPSSEEELELAEATRNKLHVKMNDSACVEKRAEELKANVYPPNTPAHLVPRLLPTTSQVNIGLYVITHLFWDFEKTCKKRITPTGITEGEMGFEQTKRCYLTEVIPFFNLLKEHFEGIQKSLVTEVRAMKAVFEILEAEVDQNETDLRSGEIEQKNLILTNENLVTKCLSKDVFYTATDSVLNVSRFSDMHDVFTSAQKRIADLEFENFNLRNKIQNDDHDSMIKHLFKLEVEHFNL
ncbi:hypothetical protein Tco_0348087 [Tanacetum coccineum]